MHVRSYMTVRHNMLFEDPQVERVLIELQEISFSLETHKYCMRVSFTVLVRDLSYSD